MHTPAPFRTLLGVDVIDSGRTPPHLMPQVPVVLRQLLTAAMDHVGISHDDAVDTQFVGDGWLHAFPGDLLGQVVDLGRVLDDLVAEHNMWNKLELRLRLAVDAGPLPDGQGFHPANIARARLLDAAAFKALARRCIAERPDGSMSTAMIVSDSVYQPLFRGAYTKVARAADFAEIEVANKEFTARAWVAVPGFDARTLAAFAAEEAPAASTPVEESKSTSSTTISNSVTGDVSHGVIAGIIHGGVNLGSAKP